MSTQPNNRIEMIISEIIQIDPELERYRADLPKLILSLERKRPNVTLDRAFMTDLRAQLLAYKPAPTPDITKQPSALFWWTTRLTPIGIAIVLFVILTPEHAQGPINTPSIPESFPSTTEEDLPNDASLERTMKAPDQTTEEELFSTMMAPSSIADSEIVAPTLAVIPPLPGTTLTIQTLTVPEAGWLVIFEDQGGAFGERLGAQYLEPGAYQEFEITLSRPLQYPELITVALYTGTVTTQFEILQESLQFDQSINQPILVTVPVISELELETTP
jgi:hypothetical protein